MTAGSLLAAVHALFVTPPPPMALTIISALVDLGTEEGCQLPRCKILTNLGGGISAAGLCNNQQGVRVIWYSNYNEVKGLMLVPG